MNIDQWVEGSPQLVTESGFLAFRNEAIDFPSR
jgi:hypothetical protein